MSSTGPGELRGDPAIQNYGLRLYDQSNTARTQHHPQATPIQEGAVLGQAHHCPRDIISPDRTDQDGLESIQSIDVARQPDDTAVSVYEQHMQYVQPPTTQGGHQDRYQRIVQPASASSSPHTDYRSHDSPQQSTVANQHVSSTHEALTRGLCMQMGHSMYTEYWIICFNSISARRDPATAEAFANNMLYYPDGRPVLKCLQCQREHDEGSPFEHAATCIVLQCLISITLNHNNIQAISPRCRLAEGQSETCIDSNLTDYVTAIQTIDSSSLQNPAAASDISPPQTPGRKNIQHPSYADRQNRIRSFENWPTSSKQSPKRLATAGFYYTGTADHCRCFDCGGLLRDWEDNDDPMKEHQHWFPDCPFVLDAKNVACNTRTSTDKDVTNVKERNRRAIEAIEDGVTELSLQERDVPGCSNFQTLVDMGFAREAVLLAAQSLGRRAQHAYSIEDLLNALMKQNSTTGNDPANIPPAMDANICGGCNRNEIAVTQYRCGHIVCRKCMARMDSDGNSPCRICGQEVTKVVAIDSSAFKN